MNDIGAMLSELQEKMIQFIIPALITATVSMLTLFINTFLTIRKEITLKRKDTYENMKNFYPVFRTKLVCIHALYKEIVNNAIFNRVSVNGGLDLSSFVGFNDLDDFLDKNNLNDQPELANELYILVKKMIEEIVELNSFLMNQIVPIHGKKAKKLLLTLHEYCVFITWINENNNKYRNISENYNYNFENLLIIIKQLKLPIAKIRSLLEKSTLLRVKCPHAAVFLHSKASCMYFGRR